MAARARQGDASLDSAGKRSRPTNACAQLRRAATSRRRTWCWRPTRVLTRSISRTERSAASARLTVMVVNRRKQYASAASTTSLLPSKSGSKFIAPGLHPRGDRDRLRLVKTSTPLSPTCIIATSRNMPWAATHPPDGRRMRKGVFAPPIRISFPPPKSNASSRMKISTMLNFTWRRWPSSRQAAPTRCADALRQLPKLYEDWIAQQEKANWRNSRETRVRTLRNA